MKLGHHQEVNYNKQFRSKHYKYNTKNHGISTKDKETATTPNGTGRLTNNGNDKKYGSLLLWKKGHTKTFCKYKSDSCSNCSKIDHLKIVCKAKVKKFII